MNKKTYTAIWRNTGEIIYTKKPFGNLFGALPLGAIPKRNKKNLNPNLSDEEWWDGAEFITPSGREILVKKDN